MATNKKVAKHIAQAISEQMTEAKFNPRKEKYQKDIDDYVDTLILRYVPVELRKALYRYADFVKTTSIIQFSNVAEPKSHPRTIVSNEMFPFYLPIPIPDEAFKKLVELDSAKWAHIGASVEYQRKLRDVIYKLGTPEAIVKAIPESKDYVAKFYPSIENELASLNTLAEKA